MAPDKVRALITGAPVVSEEVRNPYHVIDLYTVAIVLYRKGGDVAGYALIDASDLPAVAPFRWSLHVDGYAQTAAKRGRPWGNRMHRLLMAPGGSDLFTDHINRDRLDNRRRNLRLVPVEMNAQNVSANRGARSRHRGVTFNPSSRLRPWQATVGVRGRVVYVGRYRTEDGAAEAAKAFRLRHLPGATD